ncbi:Sensor protein FixL [Phycisphaerae bacterium RAS1]|nr:Sensor protein FixL [Phycisphaerae bacterium RAS1]
MAAWLCPTIGLIAAGWALWSGRRDLARLEDEIAARNRLKLASLADGLESYLTHIGITLRTIASAPGVRQMRADSRDYIDEIYQQNHARHRLAEVYVIQSDFDGQRRPFMTFEHEESAASLSEIHSLDREAVEYAVQREQIRRFAADPAATEDVSPPVMLCVGQPGIIYSVPIRDGPVLRGIVAGMIPSQTLAHLLETGDATESAVLLDSASNVVVRLRAGEEMLAQVAAAVAARGAGEPGARTVAGWMMLTARVRPADGAPWRLAFVYDLAAQLGPLGVNTALPGLSIAATVALLGLIAGILFRTTRALLLTRHEALSRAEELSHVARVTSISELATGLAHEINQPLTAIVTYAEACRVRASVERQLPDDTREDLDAIANEAQRATAIVDRVRRFLKKRPPERAIEDPHRLVRDSVALLAPVLRETRVEVRFDFAGGAPRIRADAVQVMQVLVNLLRNAVEAIERGAAATRLVQIRTRTVDGQFECAIEDSGPPVDDQHFRRLFTLFHSTKPGGLGMGLRISRTIAESHGGRLWAVRRTGGGLTLRFTLPLEPGAGRDGA